MFRLIPTILLNQVFWFFRKALTLSGWQYSRAAPEENNFVLIVAPHTSNWDFPLFLSMGFPIDRRVFWLVKKEALVLGLKSFARHFGAIPVDRGNTKGLIDEVKERLRKYPKSVIIITPEGTRSKREHWKPGFYKIASELKLPIICGFIDYARKEVGFGNRIFPSSSMKEDMEQIRDFYRDIRGKYPEKESDIQFKKD